MRFHKAHLTRRLILDTSADSEKEENMVEWQVFLFSPLLNVCNSLFHLQCILGYEKLECQLITSIN